MGKGKRRDNKHHKTSSNQESSRNRQASADKTNPPAHTNSLDGSKTTNSVAPSDESRGKFSRRKIVSNWDRYSEDDVSSKITEEKLVQRLTQLVEQSALQASQSNFQPSLDALRDLSTLDEDIYNQTFDIDCDYLADSISELPIHERLDLNPLYCKDIRNSSLITERSGNVTLEVHSLSETHSSGYISDASKHMSDVTSLVMSEKNKSKQAAVTAMPSVKETVDTVIVNDEDQLLAKLLAAKTENILVKDKVFKMATTVEHTKTILPDVTDEENDCLLEELLAQPI